MQTETFGMEYFCTSYIGVICPAKSVSMDKLTFFLVNDGGKVFQSCGFVVVVEIQSMEFPVISFQGQMQWYRLDKISNSFMIWHFMTSQFNAVKNDKCTGEQLIIFHLWCTILLPYSRSRLFAWCGPSRLRYNYKYF